jgi:hypothetical protein
MQAMARKLFGSLSIFLQGVSKRLKLSPFKRNGLDTAETAPQPFEFKNQNKKVSYNLFNLTFSKP